MKALVGIRKHLCVILVVQPQTQERHRDAKPLYYKRRTKGNQIEKLPLYLEKLLKLSTLKSSVTKELKEKILHYHNQKFLPEMMVMAKGVNVGISTIYYWIHHGKLG
ncbi:transposase [Streptococcus pneumoniae]|nr:transposase [Streptococcus pneumoniae]